MLSPRKIEVNLFVIFLLHTTYQYKLQIVRSDGSNVVYYEKKTKTTACEPYSCRHSVQTHYWSEYYV